MIHASLVWDSNDACVCIVGGLLHVYMHSKLYKTIQKGRPKIPRASWHDQSFFQAFVCNDASANNSSGRNVSLSDSSIVKLFFRLSFQRSSRPEAKRIVSNRWLVVSKLIPSLPNLCMYYFAPSGDINTSIRSVFEWMKRTKTMNESLLDRLPNERGYPTF